MLRTDLGKELEEYFSRLDYRIFEGSLIDKFTMRGARQLRSSDLNLILPTSQSTSAQKPQQTGFDSDYADILGADESRNTYSAEVVDRNVVLQSDILEIEQLLETTSEVQLEGVRTQKDILMARNLSSVEALEKFDGDFRFPTSSLFNKEKLIESLDLDVQVGSLLRNLKIARRIGKLRIELGTKPSSPTHAGHTDDPLISMTPRTNFDNASSAVSSARSMGSGISVLPAEVGVSVARMEELLSELHQKLESSQMQQKIKEEVVSITHAYFGGSQGASLGNALVQLNAMAFTDVMQFIKNKVNSMNELLGERQAAVDHAHRVFIQATDADPIDVVAYEAALVAYIDALEEAMKVNADRLNQLMMNTDSEGNFRSSYEETSELIKTTIVESRANRADLLKDIRSDLGKLQVEGQRRFVDATAAQESYDAFRVRSLHEIGECSSQQEALWGQVEALVARIGEIGKTRASLVKEHQSVTEKECQRRRYYDEFALAHKNHVNHLNTLKELSHYTMKVLEHMENFWEHMTTAVEAKNFEEGLHEMKQDDQERFVHLHGRFLESCSNLLGRRAARQLVVARSVRVCESLLADPLEPDREQQKTLYAEGASLLAQLEVECNTVAARAERWQPLYENVMEQMEVIPSSTISDPHTLWSEHVSVVQEAMREAAQADDAEVSAIQQKIDELQQRAALNESQFKDLRHQSPPRKKFVKESRSRRLTGRTPRTPSMRSTNE